MKTIIFILGLLLAIPAIAQNEYEVKVEPSNLYPSLNEQIKIVYKLRYKGNSGNFNLSGLRVSPPSFNGFKKLKENAGMSMGMSFGFGQSGIDIYEYQVLLRPTKEGEITIDPVKFIWNGKTFASEKITLEVSKSTGGGNQNFNSNKQIIARISLSKSKVYQGEHVVATYKLYSKFNRLESADNNYPTQSGFWKYDIDPGKKGWGNNVESVNGVQYVVFTLKKELLYPQQYGKLKLKPFDMSVIANRTFFNSGTQFDVTSNAPVLEVLQLPTGTKPPSFTGAVGAYDMNVDISRTELKSNEGIDITVSITGRGNVKLIEKIALDFPKTFDTSYDPEVKSNVSVSPSGVKGKKEFKYLVIPRKSGVYEIGPIEFSYFDSESKSYRTLSSEKYTINVEKSEEELANPVIETIEENEQPVVQSLAYLKEYENDLRKQDDFFFGSLPYLAATLSPALLFLLFLFVKKRSGKTEVDETAINMKQANKIALKRLAEAKKFMDANQSSEFYNEISHALHGYLEFKMLIKTAEMSKQNIREQLSKRGVSEATTSQLMQILERCEMARFASYAIGSEQEIYQNSISTIENIEKEL
jgi:hypothetical protein